MRKKAENTKHTHGPRNPAGTKIIRQFYRVHHGVKESAEKARKWYGALKERK